MSNILSKSFVNCTKASTPFIDLLVYSSEENRLEVQFWYAKHDDREGSTTSTQNHNTKIKNANYFLSFHEDLPWL